MQIFIITLKGRPVTLDVFAEFTISTIKLMIEEIEGIPPHQQRLIFAGKPLDDDRTLEQYGIGKEHAIHLCLRIRGGMFKEVNGATSQTEPTRYLQVKVKAETEEFLVALNVPINQTLGWLAKKAMKTRTKSYTLHQVLREGQPESRENQIGETGQITLVVSWD